jgi:hypothetical protein
VIAAWENRYVVPFLSARGSVSVPVDAREVDVTEVGDTATFVGTPRRTWILGATAGVRVPVGASGATRANLLGGLGMTHLRDAEDEQNVLQLGVGAELVF